MCCLLSLFRKRMYTSCLSPLSLFFQGATEWCHCEILELISVVQATPADRPLVMHITWMHGYSSRHQHVTFC